ncbi:MAG: Hsp33 family molecular chaperone HslO [Atopostipes suicloacalis]|nr:Hsp33 family molecular chaperone HslO [Atopostipes suicloacalis]
MTDSLVKALAYNDEIRIYAMNATNMVEEARQTHDSWSAATAALGRTIIASTLLGATLKNEQDKLTVRVQGDGPVGAIVVDANMHGKNKGYIQNPHVSLDLNENGKIDVGKAVGNKGFLIITKDQGLKTPFVGQVPLVSGELGEDFTYYMAVSEQTPSSFGLSVLINPDESVEVAGGFMIQVLPGASEETIDQLEKSLTKIKAVSTILNKTENLDFLLEEIVGKNNYRIIERMPISFECNCSKERFSDAIISLGKNEIQTMIDEDNGAVAECHFCRKKYNYSASELEKLKINAEKMN